MEMERQNKTLWKTELEQLSSTISKQCIYNDQDNVKLGYALRRRLISHSRKYRNRLQLIWSMDFDKGAKAIQWRMDCLFKKWFWKKRQRHTNNQPQLSLHSMYKNSLKMNHIPNVKLKSIKPLDENIYDLKLGNILFQTWDLQKACAIEEKTFDFAHINPTQNFWLVIKIWNFCPLKDTVKKMKR